VAAIAGRVFSIFFIVLAVIEAQSGKNTDLDEARIQLRKYFTYFIGLIVLITILSELGLDDSEQQLPRLLQRTAILLFNTLFIVINFSVKSRLFDTRKKKPGVRHPELIEKIQSVMLDQELYRQEKLTIGQLAAAIGEQEYKVRKVINQEMGYRNFIDFTNSYRIKEATDLLKDRSKTELTILEIAYKTGFNSIGPFNRSFKQATGLTPTDYRNKHLNH
jgi:AraC-like DNA-binding protein